MKPHYSLKENFKVHSTSLVVMPPHRGRAVTHADVAPGPRSTELGSKTSASLMALTVLSGLFCSVLCLIAEATRSKSMQPRFVGEHDGKGDGGSSECTYSGSGSTPLMCGAIAFGELAVTMVVEHVYMLIAVSKAHPLFLVSWDSDGAIPARNLARLAAFFFVASWLCFGAGEILLLVGLSVESGHLNDWDSPRSSCLILRQGVFSAAAVSCLLTVLLAAGLYLTASRALKMCHETEGLRRQVLETAALYASPAPRVAALAREDPIIDWENTSEHPPVASDNYKYVV